MLVSYLMKNLVAVCLKRMHILNIFSCNASLVLYFQIFVLLKSALLAVNVNLIKLPKNPSVFAVKDVTRNTSQFAAAMERHIPIFVSFAVESA